MRDEQFAAVLSHVVNGRAPDEYARPEIFFNAKEEVVTRVLRAAGAVTPLRLLGWEPRHSLDAGLAKTVAWFREHGNRYP